MEWETPAVWMGDPISKGILIRDNGYPTIGLSSLILGVAQTKVWHPERLGVRL